MFKRPGYSAWLFFLLDLFAWLLAQWFALWLRFPAGIPGIELEYFWRFIPLAGAGMLLAFYTLEIYDYDPFERLNWQRLVGGWSLGIGLAFSFHFLLKVPYSRFAFLTGALLFFGLTVLERLAGSCFTRIITGEPGPSAVTVGFKTENIQKIIDSSLSNKFNLTNQLDAAEIAPPFDHLQELAPDVVVVNGERVPPRTIRRLTLFGRRRQIAVLIRPDSSQLFFARTRPQKWRDLVLLEPQLDRRLQHQFVFKHCLDYLVGGLFSVVALPLVVVVAGVILLVEGRPVIYTQQRVGRDGKKFTLYKFRTMETGAEVKDELTRGPDDPRITRLGSFLRRWSLDELPQLFNVLRGEMSLVGPRPELASITSDYDSKQRRIFWLKPGLTGLSQVSGREKLPLEEKLKLDQFYVQKYSLLLDLRIFLKTFYVVLKGEGSN